jgi:hypothetical protein
VAVLISTSLIAMGARCIENVAVRSDDQGNTYLLGEIYNDTDVQGTQIVVRAMLKDLNGAVVATKDTTTCPPDLQPGGLSSYGVQFDEKNLPAGLTWEVRPIAGVTLPKHNPDSGVVVTSKRVVRRGTGLDVTFKVRNQSNLTHERPQLCAVMYDGSGKVGSWSPFDPAYMGIDTTLRPDETVDLSFNLRDQSPDAASVRVWLWIPGPDPGTSRLQPVMTDPIQISP